MMTCRYAASMLSRPAQILVLSLLLSSPVALPAIAPGAANAQTSAKAVDPLNPRYRPTIKSTGIKPAVDAASVWITNSLVKVLQSAAADTPQSLQISAARNEFESFQVHLRAGSNTVAMDLSVSDFVNTQNSALTIPSASNVVVHREAYQNITTPSDDNGVTGSTPDPLIPVKDPYFKEVRNAFPFTVAPNTVQSAWIDVQVPSDAASGYYQATVSVKDGATVLAELTVTLKVWNFTLPSTATLKSAFGLSQYGLCIQAYGRGSDNGYSECAAYPPAANDAQAGADLTMLQQAVVLLDHRISTGSAYGSPNLSMSAFDAKYGALMNGNASNLPAGAKAPLLAGARWTSVVFGPPAYLGTAQQIQDWASHFTTNGWLASLFHYTCDEPPAGCTWADALSNADFVHSAASSMKTLITTNLQSATDHGLLDAYNILTPIVNDIDPLNGANQRSAYDTWLGGNDKHLWWYQACPSHSCGGVGSPAADYQWPSYMIDATPVRNRVFQWLAFINRIEGELYYQLDWCWIATCQTTDPWDGVYAYGGNGDGTLIYPGTVAKIGGTTPIALASIRLKHIRDGMEDFEYLHLLSAGGNDAFARTTAASFITNASTFNNDPTALASAREALGDKLHELSFTTPVVTTDPANQSVAAGQTATFTAAADGFPVPTAQWQQSTDGGQSFSDIANETAITLSFTASLVQNGNRYRAVFSNAAGTATSAAATLTVPSHVISVSASPVGGGTVSGAGTFAEGASLTVTASANSGYVFSNWTENSSVVSTSASYTFTLTADRNLVANFTQVFTISVVAFPVAGGTVSGAGTFAEGGSQTVTASANSGYVFSNWTESSTVVSTSASYTFTLTADRNLVANFSADPSVALQVTPATNMISLGSFGGPFNPSSFSYTLGATSGTVNWQVSGLPDWLTASAASGSASTSGATVTFSVNTNATTNGAGTYGPATVTFTNTSNAQGNTTRMAGLTVSPVACEVLVKGPEFGGDSKGDLLWRNDSGGVGLWFMNGAAVSSLAGLGSVSTDWRLIGAADFNGDGKSDLLWRNTATGAVAIWFVSGASVTGSAVIASVSLDWKLVGAADFNGDGKADLLWRNDDGSPAIWLLNNGSLQSAAGLGPVGSDWRIVGIADFNGDGKADIAWRNTSGAAAIWLMNGTSLQSGAGLGTIGNDWRIVGVGDFNGDGKADIAWRNDNTTYAMWFMNGASLGSTGVIGAVSSDWHLTGTNDFDGDGKTDLLWRQDTGNLGVWLMNGASLTSAGGIAGIAYDWHIVNGEHDRPPVLIQPGPC